MKQERAVRKVTLYLTRDHPRFITFVRLSLAFVAGVRKGSERGLWSERSAMGAQARVQIPFTPYLSNAACHTG